MHMIKLAAVLALALAVASAAHAKNLTLPLEDPTTVLTVPASWTSEKTDSGYTCESEDKEAMIVFETADKKEIEQLVDANIDWLMKEEKVEIDKSTEKKDTIESGGFKWSTVSWAGKNEEWGPASIMLAFADIGNDQMLMITYWVTTKGAEKHKEDIESILDSIKKIE